MESIKPIGKRIEYNYSAIADKHYFGGFLNLAQNNIDGIKQAFKQRFDKSLNDYFSNNISTTDFENGIDYLKQYLPVVKYLYLPTTDDQFKNVPDHEKETKRREYFKKSILMLFRAIKGLRDFYTHYYHAPKSFDDDLYNIIDTLLLSVVEDVKKHKMKSDSSKHLLKVGLNDELSELKKLKIEEIREAKKQGKGGNDAVENAVLNDAFYHLLYKNGVNRNYQSKYSGEETENKIPLSESGLLFLLGMFLTRKQSEDLRSRIKGFKAKVIRNPEQPIDRNNNSLKYMATHWVFGYLGFKEIKHRLTTGFSKETLLVQMIDELSKVPDEVYQTFSKELQKEFIEDVNEYFKEGKNIESLDESKVIHPVIRKRYEDKFDYFALRYLDEFADFPTLRFQIHLGNYVHDRRTKSIEGTDYVTDRVVKEKIKVFGKLSEVSNLKTDYFLKNKKEDMDGWEIYPNPSYNFVADNTPIFINLQQSEVKGSSELFGKLSKLKSSERSSKKRSLDKLDKKQITGLIDKNLTEKKFKDIYVGEPTAILSLNEIPALIYELLINKRTGEEIEAMLVEKLIQRYQIISNYKTEDKLPTSQITKKLRKGTTEETINTSKLINAVEKELTISNEKLALILTNRREFRDRQSKRKYVFTNRELGQEATWLADDLKRFMPLSGRENWRGHHHSQLQQSLAYYNQKPKEALSLLKEFWDFSDDTFTWNKGIKAAFNASGFDDLYDKYLKNRKAILLGFLEQIKGFTNNRKLLNRFIKQQNIWNIFYKRLYVIDAVNNQINKLLSKPLVFPRGIFDEKPTYIKGGNIEETPELYADWYRLFYDYSDFQRFYNFDREYRELYAQSPDTEENKYNLSEQQKFELFKRKQGKKIKKVQIQDLFLLMLAKDIFAKTFNYEVESLKLSDLYLTQQERLEEEEKARKQSQRPEGDTSENIIKSSYIWTMTVPYKSGQIDEPKVKIKELGKFKRFLDDEKVIRIQQYGGTKLWTKLELEQELELLPTSYEVVRREKLLKEIHEFEHFILEKFGFDGSSHPGELEQDGNPNFKMYIANGVLKKHNLAGEEEVKWIEGLTDKTIETTTKQELENKPEIVQKAFLLVLIRNKFAHNQLPKKEYFDMVSGYTGIEGQNISYSEVYLHFVQQTINEIKSLMLK